MKFLFLLQFLNDVKNSDSFSVSTSSGEWGEDFFGNHSVPGPVTEHAGHFGVHSCQLSPDANRQQVLPLLHVSRLSISLALCARTQLTR